MSEALVFWDAWRLDAPADIGALSDAERERAARFATESLKRRYEAGRAGLRARLGAALGEDPAALSIAEGDHGKPELVGAALHFNLSHSRDLAFLAWSDAGPVGADVEAVAPRRADIAGRWFSSRERAAIALWDDPTLGFCAAWTAKEAVMKGLGLGFRLALNAFEIEAPPDEAPRLLSLPAAIGDARVWSLQRLEPALGYLATIAVRALEPIRCARVVV